MAKDYALHHTGLTVFDIRRSLEFYRDVLGFEVVYEHEKSGGYLADVLGYPDAHLKIALLKLPRSEHRIELLQYISPEGVHADVEPKNVGAVHVAYIVEDIHEIYAHLPSWPEYWGLGVLFQGSRWNRLGGVSTSASCKWLGF